MSINEFKEQLVKNWFPLTVCFVIAVFIYFFHQMSILDKKTYTVPLSVKNEGKMLPYSDLGKNKNVKVTIRGLPDQIAVISEKDFSVSIDLSNQVEEGIYEAPVLLSLSDRVLLMEPVEVSVKPEKISVRLEEKTVAAVPIVASIAGFPAHGFEKGEITVSPDLVTIYGPKNMVKHTEYISTAGISIEGASQNVKKSVRLVNPNSLISLDDVSEYEVTVAIQPKSSSVVFTDIPVVYENLFNEIEVTSSQFTVDLELSGDEVAIEKVVLSQIKAYVDCSFVNDAGKWELPVKFKYPNGLNFVSSSLEKITVTTENNVYDTDEQSTDEEENKDNVPENKNEHLESESLEQKINKVQTPELLIQS